MIVNPKLDPAVQLVTVQFSLYSHQGDLVPPTVSPKPKETPNKFKARKSYKSGNSLWNPSKRTDAKALLDALIRNDFVIVEATYEERINYKKNDGSTYWAVRYVFARRELDFASHELRTARGYMLSDMRELLKKFYHVRSYVNPYYRDGELVEDNCTLSLNLEYPEHPFKNGNPIQPKHRVSSAGIVLKLDPVIS